MRAAPATLSAALATALNPNPAPAPDPDPVPSPSPNPNQVSGGLAAKLESAAAIAASGVPVCIVQVGTPHAAEALAGRWPEVCTRVVGQAQAAQLGQDFK